MRQLKNMTFYKRRYLLLVAGLVPLFILCIGSCNNTSVNKESEKILSEAEMEEDRLMKLQANWDLVEDGIHVRTGLKDDEHLQLVLGACTSCHSAKLITQNRATREGWKQMFTWMYETQGLPDLGVHEPKILDYLAEHYAPEEEVRRKKLDMAAIEWYMLEVD